MGPGCTCPLRVRGEPGSCQGQEVPKAGAGIMTWLFARSARIAMAVIISTSPLCYPFCQGVPATFLG